MAETLSRAELASSMSQVLGFDVEEFSRKRGGDLLNFPLREMYFDSLTILEFGILLEDMFGVSVNPGQFSLTATTTVQELLDFINLRNTPPTLSLADD